MCVLYVETLNDYEIKKLNFVKIEKKAGFLLFADILKF